MNDRLSIRVNEEEKKSILERAEKLNLSISEYIRMAALSENNDLAEKREFAKVISVMCNDIHTAANILQEDHSELADSLYRRSLELWQFLK